MGLLSAMFGKKAKENNPEISPTSIVSEAPPHLHLRGKPDAYGLYPSELVILAVAERFKTTEANFSSTFLRTYEITNPSKILKSLYTRGFLQICDPNDMLPSLKVAELKEIATCLGVEVNGKKADIISALSTMPPEKLSSHVKERKWKLTETGHSALRENPYIMFFLDSHPYDVRTVGVTIWSVNEDFVKDTKRLHRDIIYHQLNERMNEAFIAFLNNPLSGTADTNQYCECHRLMSLFIEEEGSSYINAADLYFQYIYKRINIHEGMRLLAEYKLFRNDKQHQRELIDRFYNDVQLCPFQRTELLRLLDKLDIDDKLVRDTLITSFKRAHDTGIMTESETADFVIYELTGELDKSRDLATKLAKKAVKRI